MSTLIVPGLGSSGPDHWQSWWLRQDRDAEAVLQPDWSTPDLDVWSATVVEQIDRTPGRIWLVAHSFGCLASVCATQQRPERIAGLLLVAPADPRCFAGLDRTRLRQPLAAPSLLVASDNDPWMSTDRASIWARRWHSHLFNLGSVGHINVDAGFGPWPLGRQLLAALQQHRRQIGQRQKMWQGKRWAA